MMNEKFKLKIGDKVQLIGNPDDVAEIYDFRREGYATLVLEGGAKLGVPLTQLIKWDEDLA